MSEDTARAEVSLRGGAIHRLVPILENVPIARDTYRLRLADVEIAGAIRPASS